MIADITPGVSYQSLNVKADYDGEDRVLDVEMGLEIPIQMYENRNMEQVTDIYGTAMEVIPEYSNKRYKVMRDKCQGRVKIIQSLKIPASFGKILQVCHANGVVCIEDSRLEKDGLIIDGFLNVNVLYITDNDRRKYEMLKKEIPFSYEMSNLNLNEKCQWKIVPMLEQCHTVILDENNMEIKAMICMELMIEEWEEKSVVSNVRVKSYAEEIINNSPGMVVYIPSQKENIWDVGKHYCVSRESIREINQLAGDEIQKGQKILLVKSMC